VSAHQILGWSGVWCALALFSPGASAQLAVFPVQDLAFGQIQPGVPDVVLPSDAVRRAHFDVTGRGDFTITIGLPSLMTSPTGALVPLAFTATDGLAVRRGNLTTFDPAVPFDLRLRPNSTTSVYIGATATPAPTQEPGTYTATITLTIVPAGL
jgi:hypothetical protein